MYEGMCLRAFYKLYQDSTVSLPPRKVCAVWRPHLAGFFHFRAQCFLQTLEAPADFTTLVLSIKCEHTPHTWALDSIRMPIATGIKTKNWNKCIDILSDSGWNITYKYDEFDAGIDFDFIRFEKENEKILLGWDNWFEGEIKAEQKHLNFLSQQAGIELKLGEPENLKKSIIAMYDRPNIRTLKRLFNFFNPNK